MLPCPSPGLSGKTVEQGAGKDSVLPLFGLVGLLGIGARIETDDAGLGKLKRSRDGLRVIERPGMAGVHEDDYPAVLVHQDAHGRADIVEIYSRGIEIPFHGVGGEEIGLVVLLRSVSREIEDCHVVLPDAAGELHQRRFQADGRSMGIGQQNRFLDFAVSLRVGSGHCPGDILRIFGRMCEVGDVRVVVLSHPHGEQVQRGFELLAVYRSVR